MIRTSKNPIGKRALLGASVLAVFLGGCSLPTSQAAPSTSSVKPNNVAISAANILSVGIEKVDGNGWDASGLQGGVPSLCHSIGGDVAFALPDPKCTPGAINKNITQTNISTTICEYGYTKTIRPPESMTEPYKYKIMAAYGYSGQSPYKYELDHLVPLELGGASTTSNLWPELDNHPSSYYLNSKDIVENELHLEVCTGRITLAQAQNEIVSNWTKVLT
jgi:hypothetical protein